YEVARELLRKLRAARHVPARLLGVAVSQLVTPEARAQLSLFDEVRPLETEHDRTISRVIDQVREKFGPDALGRARGRSHGSAFRFDSLVLGAVAAASDAAASAGTKSACDLRALGKAWNASRLTPAFRKAWSSRAPSPGLSGAVV